MFVSLHYDAKCNLDNSKFSVQYLKKLTPDDDHSISGDRVQLPPPPLLQDLRNCYVVEGTRNFGPPPC